MVGHELEQLRAEAQRLLVAGLAVAFPGRAVTEAIDREPVPPPADGGRRLILALGRSAVPMANAARDRLGPCETLVVTTPDGAARIEGARALTAAVSGSDSAGLRAAEAVEAALARLGPRDQLVVLLSAGAAAVVPAPAPGLTLADLQQTERRLADAGAGRCEIALVRQQLTRLEGGGLLRAAGGAEVFALALVPPDESEDPRRLAGGLVGRPLGSRVTARALLDLYGVTERLSPALRKYLSGAPTGLPPDQRVRLRHAGSNALSLAAIGALGATVAARPLIGMASELVHDIHAAVAGIGPGQALAVGIEPAGDWPQRAPEPPGGEGGVLLLAKATVEGRADKRLADLGIRFALLARDRRLPVPWSLALATTGGDAAGVVVDSATLGRLARGGLDPDGIVEDGGAYAALEQDGGLWRGGPGGADVGDLAVFVRG